jgi:hypothetical protein
LESFLGLVIRSSSSFMGRFMKALLVGANTVQGPAEHQQSFLFHSCFVGFVGLYLWRPSRVQRTFLWHPSQEIRELGGCRIRTHGCSHWNASTNRSYFIKRYLRFCLKPIWTYIRHGYYKTYLMFIIQYT